MLSRRLFVGALCAPLAARPAMSQGQMPPIGSLRFDIQRNQGRIGRHGVQLDRQGNIVTARIQVEVAVGIGPIVVYRYSLSATETWRDGRFAAFDSECNDDGTRLSVRAESREEGVVVSTGNAPWLVLPRDTVPMTHWNRACLHSPLFEARDGKPARPKVTPRGMERLALADGRTVQAERYSYSGDIELDDWYDTAGSWAGMRTTGRDGSIIEYRRLGG